MIRPGALRAVLFLGVFCLTVSAQAVWTTVKQVDSGPSNRRLDLVILGDGYTAAEMPLFRTHVSNFINYWHGLDPVGRYRNLVNIWRVEVVSAQSGSDKPAPCYNPPVLVNTALNSTYCTGGTQRCVTANTSLSLMTAALNVPEYDTVVVLVNDPEYGGCASTISTSTGVHSAASEVVAHELGHSLIGLADEYWNNGTTYTGGEASQVNVTVQNAAQIAASGTKWSHWLNQESVTAHEGCRYFEFGLFRPRNDCRMRSLYVTFCPVCREAHVERFWQYTNGVDTISPSNSGPLPYATTLSVTYPSLFGTPLLTEWSVDGVLVSAGSTSTSNGLVTASFNPMTVLNGATGQHSVVFRAVDPTGWYRKSTRYEVLGPVTWTMSDTTSDLSPTGLTMVTTPVRHGEVFRISETITNLGTTPSPVSQVSYFASSDATLTTGDIRLGSRVLPPLAAGASVTVQTDLRLNAAIPFPTLRIGLILDEPGVVPELSESNNQMLGSSFVILTAPTLTVAPTIISWTNEATVTASLNFGSGYAGRSYGILPSLAQQTGAATDLGLFLGTAPFVPDDLSLQVLNAQVGPPFFNSFFGTLDSQGRTSATFVKPALPSLGAIVISFWAFATDTNPQSGQITMPIISNRSAAIIL